MNRKLSSLIFLIVIIMFSFPWVMVSCGGQPLMTATGFQAMSGSYGGVGNLTAEYGAQAPKTQVDVWLVFALIVAIIGIIVGILNGDKNTEKMCEKSIEKLEFYLQTIRKEA
jgi:ABC-type methionine transport system permease subunit